MKPEIDIFEYEDKWQKVKNAALNTIGKTKGSYPDDIWKKSMLQSEHSPIRRITFFWRWNNLKYWVSVHFARHKFGIEHWVKTQRTDRTGIKRDELPQGSFVQHSCEADVQALINMSRRRLCSCASPETRGSWQLVKDEVSKVDPIIASCMVRECIYRGFCPELNGCGFDKTEQFKKELEEYRKRD